MELFDFLGILYVAITKDFEDRMWLRWLSEKQNMEKPISFTAYLELFKPKKEINKNINVKSILEEAEKIKMADQKGDK
jgi:hypothetical protein